jgi:hypothetical protein
MILRAFLLGVSLLFVVPAAHAQTAAGLPSFDDGPFVVTAGVGFGDTTSFTGGFLGGTDEFFGGIGVGYSSFDDLDTSATAVSGTVGTTLALDSRGRVSFSPIAGVGFVSGPDLGEVDVDIFGVRVGGRLGILATTGGPVSVVPTFGLDFAYDRVNAELLGASESSSDTFAIARLGAGLLFNRRMALVPHVSMPLGRDDSDVSFNVTFAYNFR